MKQTGAFTLAEAHELLRRLSTAEVPIVRPAVPLFGAGAPSLAAGVPGQAASRKPDAR